MKTNFKRLFALVLTLCMLASLMVPVAFAEDEAVAAPSANVAETYPIRLKDMNHTDAATAEGLDALMVKTNAAGEKRYYAYTPSSSQIIEAYADGTLNWKGVATSSEYVYRSDRMYQARLGKGWSAFQIRVDELGLYSLNITTDKTVDEETETTPWSNVSVSNGEIISRGYLWSGDISAYIIPLADYAAAVAGATATETETAEVVAINSLLTDDYCVGTDNMAAEDTSVSFAKKKMAAGEYVVVVDTSASNYCISEMSLLETAEDAAKYELAEVESYGIQLVDSATMTAEEVYNSSIPEKTRFVTVTTDEAGVTTYAFITTSSGVSISKIVDSYYTNGTLNWKYLAGGHSYRPAYNFQLRMDKDGYNAFQIKIPTAGKYALTLSTGSAGTYTADAYAINVNDVPAGLTNYLDLATAENSIGDATITAEMAGAFDVKYYEAGEYVVIISNTTGAHMPVKALGLGQYPIDVIPETALSNTQVINPALYEIADPVFDQIVSKETTFATELTLNGEAITLNDYVDAQYAAGKMNWKIENYADLFSEANFKFNSIDNGGLHIATTGTSVGDWAALRIRVTSGDRYSISLTSGRSSSAHAAYFIPATSDEMSVEEIEAQMTNANLLYTTSGQAGVINEKISVGYLDGEYILIFLAPHESKTRNVYLDKITLESETFTADDKQVYNLYLYDETNPYYELVTNRYTAVTDESGATTYQPVETYADGNFGNFSGVVTSKDAEGNPTAVGNFYEAVYKEDGSGYPGSLNWRPDAIHNGNSDTPKEDMKVHNFYYQEDGDIVENTAYKFNFTGEASEFVQYGSIMLHVDKAGTYDLSITVPKTASTAKIYFVDTAASTTARTSDSTITSLIADDTYLLGDGENGYTTLTKRETTTVDTVEIDAAGDFLIIFVVDSASNADICLSNITLTPVVEEVAAGVGGETYATFEEALAAATEGDTIHLMDNLIDAGDVVVPAGVTLNLNGMYVYADSVDVAPGAQIIDASDGNAILDADATFNENNAQLPLYDVEASGYRLFNVDVESCATTGNASATKYWFKVNFSNAAALDMIDINTELRVQADMTGVIKADSGDYVAGDAWAAVAYADAAFSNSWAANSNSYIVVSAVGSNLSSFQLNPGITANGVVISGDAMTKN